MTVERMQIRFAWGAAGAAAILLLGAPGSLDGRQPGARSAAGGPGEAAAAVGSHVADRPLVGMGVGQAARDTTWTVTTTGRFEFRSDPRVGLHHLLIDWARAAGDAWPSFAAPIVERDGWRSVLDDDERRVWADAVDAYRLSRRRSPVHDDGLIAVRDWAAGAGTREAIPAADRPMADAVEAALPIYRRHWWPAHDARNRAWIESVAPTVAAIEEDVVARLEAAYGGPWPDDRIPVDLVAYAVPVGAYSTAGRVTISSADRDTGMPHAVELVFHEASHTERLEQAIRSGIRQAFETAGGRFPDRLWHDMIFYTTGELTRMLLAEHGRPGYTHYGADGVYVRGERWSTQLPILERYWRPFLRSASGAEDARRSALEAIARALLAEREEG